MEKPFKCELCGYRSSETGKMKVHMPTHTGERSLSGVSLAVKGYQEVAV